MGLVLDEFSKQESRRTSEPYLPYKRLRYGLEQKPAHAIYSGIERVELKT